LLTGLCLLIRSISCEFVLIPQQKTWDEAQLYCRQNHFDLVTLHSIEDWTNVKTAVGPALNSVVWTGLYNDIDSWRWSYQDEQMTLELWKSGQPDNNAGIQECICIDSGEWSDTKCASPYPVFCYDETKAGGDRFVYVNDIDRSWHEAQSYCRQHYTDLATIRTQAENDQLLQVSGRAWIGLFRDSWKWSDGTDVSMSSINWMSTTRGVTGKTRPCGAADTAGRITDEDCSTTLPFICKWYSKKQIVKLEVKSAQNLNDPAVRDTILQWLKQKLKDHGIEKDTTLTWRLQPDGNVFTPKHYCEEMNPQPCDLSPV
ncbi:putative L-selectin-like, partial [Triplophysa rosa]